MTKEVKKLIEVKNKSDSLTEIYISGDIVNDRWKSWAYEDDVATYPEDIRNILKDARENVTVYISSGGGNLFAGMAISNMLQRHQGHTKAIIDGVAASAASIIAFGCDEIEMPANAYLMIHKPSATVEGNSKDFLEAVKMLDDIQAGLVETYFAKAKEEISKEDINTFINDETWFTGTKAIEAFNIKLVESSKDVKNHFGLEVLNYAKVPKDLLDKVKNDSLEDDKDLDLWNKEIDIALNL